MRTVGIRISRPLLRAPIKPRCRHLHHSCPRQVPSLAALPDKVGLKLLPLACPPTAVACGFNASHARLHWPAPPRSILAVTKERDGPALNALLAATRWLAKAHPPMRVLVERSAYNELAAAHSDLPGNLLHFDAESASDRRELVRVADVAMSLGGDGTVLRLASLFEAGPVPPVLSFSMGTLGFLLPHNAAHLPRAFNMLIDGYAYVLLRMRLETRLLPAPALGANAGRTTHVMNEVALHRGRSGHMTTIDSYVNGQHLTRAIADGLIVSTPTGSTAYSLSAGGPIVHPCVQTLVLTPISPRSLSFRTVLLPPDTQVKLVVTPESRAAADLSLDGRYSSTLERGDGLEVKVSPYPMPCVYFSSQGGGDKAGDTATSSDEEDSWVRDINNLLHFNVSFAGRGLLTDSGDLSGPSTLEQEHMSKDN